MGASAPPHALQGLEPTEECLVVDWSGMKPQGHLYCYHHCAYGNVVKEEEAL